MEAATAQKHACDSRLLGAVVDRHGKVLALGRTRRLVSKAQRRALMIRDTMCQYPGCHQTRHLRAHHVMSWILGGRTDLDNLILLCRGITPPCTRAASASPANHTVGCFVSPMGSPVTGGWVMRIWPSTSPSRNANKLNVISWLEWMASSIPTLEPSGLVGPVNPSTCMPACSPVHHQTPPADR